MCAVQNFMVRTTQLLPQARYTEWETRSYASMAAHTQHVSSFKVTPVSDLDCWSCDPALEGPAPCLQEEQSVRQCVQALYSMSCAEVVSGCIARAGGGGKHR